LQKTKSDFTRVTTCELRDTFAGSPADDGAFAAAVGHSGQQAGGSISLDALDAAGSEVPGVDRPNGVPKRRQAIEHAFGEARLDQQGAGVAAPARRIDGLFQLPTQIQQL